MGKCKDNLGREAEDAVELAVKELVDEDSRILGYVRAKSSDILDQSGVDVLIFLRGGAAIPVQVKSTKKRKRSAYDRFHKLHPAVRFVIFVWKNRLMFPNSEIYRKEVTRIKKKVLRLIIRVTKALNDLTIESQ